MSKGVSKYLILHIFPCRIRAESVGPVLLLYSKNLRNVHGLNCVQIEK